MPINYNNDPTFFVLQQGKIILYKEENNKKKQVHLRTLLYNSKCDT